MTQWIRFALAASASALAIPAVAPAQAPAAVETRQIGTATIQNVPPIPDDIKASVQRYQNYREAVFQDWLADGSILITTRFGATAQVHRVTAPGGARTQLTFFDEPVADAQAIPGTQRFILTRDTGGDEWFQLFATGPSGQPVQLTEPGTRNQNLVISKDGRLAAWSRATKGSPDWSILVADPANPASRRVAFQGQGSISPSDISADGSRILLTRVINNREQRLSMLDVASGQVSELAWTSEPPGTSRPASRRRAIRCSSSPTMAATFCDWSKSTSPAAAGRRSLPSFSGRWRRSTSATTVG